MRDPDGSKPKPKASAPSSAAVPPSNPPPSKDAAGKVVHDERGNAVWNWVVETGRIFIGSTSRLLKKLETPELKVEDDSQTELRLESDRDPGGGYDPYSSGGGGGGARKPGSKR